MELPGEAGPQNASRFRVFGRGHQCARNGDSRRRIEDFTYSLEPDLERFGCMPIPPYLNRDAQEEDDFRYQTVFAEAAGSVAAPTAGLHFTPELLSGIPHAKGYTSCGNWHLFAGQGRMRRRSSHALGSGILSEMTRRGRLMKPRASSRSARQRPGFLRASLRVRSRPVRLQPAFLSIRPSPSGMSGPCSRIFTSQNRRCSCWSALSPVARKFSAHTLKRSESVPGSSATATACWLSEPAEPKRNP